jgi:hypothetical protein
MILSSRTWRGHSKKSIVGTAIAVPKTARGECGEEESDNSKS